MNGSGVHKTTLGAPKQILANVELQASVGCIVPATMYSGSDSKKVVPAGTPINVNLENLNEAVKAPAAQSGETAAVPMNAVLLHDVDVTNGAANGTALIFGFVNLNRVGSAVATKISTARGISGATPLITFVKQ